jgi:hypothetical protein
MGQDTRWRRVDLADMIGVGCGRPIEWRAEDLAEIFSHQLQTPLVCDLPLSARGLLEAELIDEKAAAGSAMTYRALFLDASPPLALLRTVKDFAKSADERSEAAMPAEIATALYFLAIAAALWRHRARITTLSDRQLGDGLTWVDRQDWIDQGLRRLCQQAMAALVDQGT